jgi:two-component system NtrC family response regulator
VPAGRDIRAGEDRALRFLALIAEDDCDMAALIAELAREEGFDTETTADGLAAEATLRREAADVLLTDLRLPGRDGLQLLEAVRAQPTPVPVVLITGYATAQDTVRAFQQGVFDIILKPFEPDQVRLVLRRLKSLLEHRQRILQLRAALAQQSADEPQATSPGMKKVLELAAQVAATKLPVLLHGETGTGKGMVARFIHRASPRAEQTFLAVNCGAIAPTLLESELFGHEKGAFTGATARRIGLLELAHGGTLFLDEINSAPPELQTRLLHFIQEQRFFRVGGTRPVEVDTRLVVASNKDLAELVAARRFREDLFYRLNVFPIHIPPLRERPEDVPLLAEYLMVKHARTLGRQVREIDATALDALVRYHWPGNVRELENVVQRALVLSAGERLTLAELPQELRPGATAILSQRPPWGERATLAEVERFWVLHVLARHQGNRTKAAAELGIDPSTLWRKLRGFGVAADSDE